MPDPTPAVPKATPPKQEFVDKYPYLVYTSQNTIVYSNSPETSIDDIGGELETATVTISNTTSGLIPFIVPFISESPEALDAAYPLAASGEATLTVALYKGTAIASAFGSLEGVLVTADGDIEYNNLGKFTITGDGSISFATLS